ncbi:TPA: TetR/AcrR family transcriptional regulator [Citrobacter freundii]|nr:TetR/AcrR family transcriptional regulator [Citrobacter freundii]
MTETEVVKITTPAQQQRREAILLAAADMFFERGYAATSVDAILAKVGGSKRSIYAEFGNKEGLFTALVSHHARYALSALEEQDAGAGCGKDIEQHLLIFGRRLMDIYFSPALLGIFRAIMAEGARFPELTRSFYEQGPAHAAIRLSEALNAAASRNEIAVDDGIMAASHFIGMLRDNLHLSVVLGLRPVPSEAETEKHVVSAVQIFLRGLSYHSVNNSTRRQST